MRQPRQLDDIVAFATAIARALGPDEAAAAVGPPLSEARQWGPEALERGVAMLRSPDVVERTTGCELLAELCNPDEWGFAPDIGIALAALAETEEDPAVLRSMVRAIGRAGHGSGMPALVRLSSHPDSEIRYDVAAAVYFCGDDADPEVVQATLIRLMSDVDDEVRDWATFGLGTQTHVDGPAVREALLRNTADPHADTRDEAILGLARRRDRRALDVVAGRLGEEDVSNMAVEAACYLADERLLPALSVLEGSWDLDHKLIRNAIAACTPEQRQGRGQAQERLLGELAQALAARPGRIRCALYCERLELGVGLRVEREDGAPLIYDFDSLVDVRSGGDIASAVRAVLADLDAEAP